MSERTLASATQNLRARLGDAVGQPVAIICSRGKHALGQSLEALLAVEGPEAVRCTLEPGATHSTLDYATTLALEVSGQGTLVLLIDPPHAGWLFATVGRPDTGLLIPNDHLYCDWLLPYDGLLRILQADYGELLRFRRQLMDVLPSALPLHIVTTAGTDLICQCGSWLGLDGEVCMAPVAGSARGSLVIDGALYEGPPRTPISLEIEDGRVASASASADETDPLAVKLRRDLFRDAGATVVAEVGLGINPCACPSGGIMEAEMARGTAHIGFGENRTLGGCNASAIHLDVGLLRPTITLNGHMLCDAGNYLT